MERFHRKNKMPATLELVLKNKNRNIKLEMLQSLLDEQLQNLFLEETPKKSSPKKIKKLGKLNVEGLIDSPPEETEFDFDKELQKIIDEDSFGEYIPENSRFESQNSALLKERVMEKYLNEEEVYPIETENLLKVHLEFPSRDELKLYRPKAWSNFKTLLQTLKEYTGSRRLYNGLKFYRMVILSKIGLKNYTEKIKNIIDKLRKIIASKIEDEVEGIVLLDEFLFTFEKRIMLEGDYLHCGYSAFEKQHISLALDLYHNINKWLPFEHDKLDENFSPYELMLFPLEEVLQRILVGNPRFPRYIYSPPGNKSATKKEVEICEWSYYYLYGNLEERYWKLDPWLDHLVVVLENIMNLSITLYERLYFERFQDRTYRPDIGKQGIAEDLNILIKNIEILSNRKRCSEFIRNKLNRKLSYTVSDKDVFDRRTDDPTVFLIYENITDDDIKKDWENTCKRIYSHYVGM